jgi:hypothetical protein
MGTRINDMGSPGYSQGIHGSQTSAKVPMSMAWAHLVVSLRPLASIFPTSVFVYVFVICLGMVSLRPGWHDSPGFANVIDE